MRLYLIILGVILASLTLQTAYHATAEVPSPAQQPILQLHTHTALKGQFYSMLQERQQELASSNDQKNVLQRIYHFKRT